MRLFHRHKWKCTGEPKYHPGIRVTRTYGTDLTYDEQCLVYGYTEIPMVCEECGKPTVNRIPGEWKP